MRIDKILLTTSLIFALSYSISAKTINGTVYLDLNKNLQFDKNEPGIPSVLVSNQVDVVPTDENGHYKMETKDECIVFITKPAGYMTPLDENNLPQFYYVHRPHGSPDLKYQGVPATGKLPRSLNFPLYQVQEPDTFQIFVLGDPQTRNDQELDYLREDVVAELVGSETKFGVALGDIMFDDLSFYSRYKKFISMAGIPFYHVAGNHDRNYDAKDDTYSMETFISHFGPPDYSFNIGKVHFVILDDIEHYFENGKANYRGGLNENQLLWLKNDLQFVSDDQLIVLMTHIPLCWQEDQTTNQLDVANADKLLEILKKKKHILALAGHTHMIQHNYIGRQLGFLGENPIHNIVCATACGAWWRGPKDDRGIPFTPMQDGAPNGYHIFTFYGNTFTEKFKPASSDENFQIRICSPDGKLQKHELENISIIVNVFDGSEKSIVLFRIDNNPEQIMSQSAMKDPFMSRLMEATADEKSQIKPRTTRHIWTAPMADELTVGVHKLVVVTKDQFGQVFKAAKIFEVE